MFDSLTLVFVQGVLMLQDQYRAVMQFSFPKNQVERGARLSHDWACQRVRNILVSPETLIRIKFILNPLFSELPSMNLSKVFPVTLKAWK